jgi:hypothetical protein
LKGKFTNVVVTQRAACGALSIFETRAFASSARADARPTTFQVVGRIMRVSVHSPHLKK